MGNGSTFGTDSGVALTIALLETQLPAVRERRRRAAEELAAVTAEQDAITKALEGLRLLSGTPLSDEGEGQGEPLAVELAPVPTEVEAPVEAEAVKDAASAPEAVEKPAAPAPDEPTTAAVTVAAVAGTGAGTGKRVTAKRASAKKAPAKKTGPAKKAAPAAASTRGAQASAPAAKKAAPKPVAPAEAAPKPAAKRVSPAKKSAAQPSPAAGEAPAEAPAPQTGRRRKVADAESVLEVLAQAAGPLRAREVTERIGLDALAGNVNAIRTRLERLAKDDRAQRTGRGLYTVAARPAAGN
ncbi:hypothetical protein [Kitasatospora sp. NPDC091207]|uniref:hypothetical protein n=1 Tax=Kitasatospora sp. NPDC091207 TaxID=3364083 RepID=UPI0037F54B43